MVATPEQCKTLFTLSKHLHAHPSEIYNYKHGDIQRSTRDGGFIFVLTILILGKLIPFGMWRSDVISREKLGEGAAPMKYCYQHYLKGRWQGGNLFPYHCLQI